MGRFGAQLLGLAIILLPTCALLGGAFAVIVLAGRRTWWRITVAAFGSYLLCALIAGFYAYVVVPADYTSDHRWTRHPTSSSLGDQHGHALVVAEATGATRPEDAAITRERVRQERRAFLRDWLQITLYGSAVPLLLLAWWRARGGRRGAGSPFGPLPLGNR